MPSSLVESFSGGADADIRQTNGTFRPSDGRRNGINDAIGKRGLKQTDNRRGGGPVKSGSSLFTPFDFFARCFVSFNTDENATVLIHEQRK